MPRNSKSNLHVIRFNTNNNHKDKNFKPAVVHNLYLNVTLTTFCILVLSCYSFNTHRFILFVILLEIFPVTYAYLYVFYINNM